MSLAEWLLAPVTAIRLDNVKWRSVGRKKNHGPVARGHAPGETRTPNLLIRSQMLYPIELRAPNSELPTANTTDYGQKRVEQSLVSL